MVRTAVGFLALQMVTKELFVRAGRRRFTHLGGIKFDGDVRALHSLFQSMESMKTTTTASTKQKSQSSSGSENSSTVEGRFDRLKRMAYILSMEELLDVSESWNEGDILNLTVGEVKRICQLRVEWSKEEVNRMVLRLS